MFTHERLGNGKLSFAPISTQHSLSSACMVYCVTLEMLKRSRTVFGSFLKILYYHSLVPIGRHTISARL